MSEWIEKNIQKFINQCMMDARFQRPLPLSASFHGVAYKKLIEILQSKSAYHPSADGSINFLGIPIHVNNSLPFGTFVTERFSSGAKLLSAKR